MKLIFKNLLAIIFFTITAGMAVIPHAFAITTPGIISLSNPSSGWGGGAQVYGWRFTAMDDFEITALGISDIDGYFEQPFSDGLQTDHSVTLWSSSGVSLASVVLQQGTGSAIGAGTLNISGTASGVFRYEDLIDAVAITAGEQYVISAFYPQYSADPKAYDVPNATGVYNPLITPTGVSYTASSSHVFPTAIGYNAYSVAGPNFLLQEISAVPVPAALPLFGTGIAIMGFMSWRRKRKVAS